jgi:phosphate transport system permease protein
MTSSDPQKTAALTQTTELDSQFVDNLTRRRLQAKLFHGMISFATAAVVTLLVLLLFKIWHDGQSYLNWDFLKNFPSRAASRAGIASALAGSMAIITMTAMISVALGIGAALYLEELAPKTRAGRFIEMNIANLCGVPSLVYGILGLAVFVRFFGFGRSILAAGFTLAIMILPIIIIASRESLRSVPNGIRMAALALGATRWQTTWHHLLPAAAPGILTGIILALSRALGEAAPLILVGGVTYIAFLPESAYDSFTTLPIQIFNWAGRPQEEFHGIAAAAIIVLIGLVLMTNAFAILIRSRMERKHRW